MEIRTYQRDTMRYLSERLGNTAPEAATIDALRLASELAGAVGRDWPAHDDDCPVGTIARVTADLQELAAEAAEVGLPEDELAAAIGELADELQRARLRLLAALERDRRLAALARQRRLQEVI